MTVVSCELLPAAVVVDWQRSEILVVESSEDPLPWTGCGAETARSLAASSDGDRPCPPDPGESWSGDDCTSGGQSPVTSSCLHHSYSS